MKKVLTASAAFALLFLGCGEEEGVAPQKRGHFEPTSPANVLRNVELAFNTRDISLLKATLGRNFVFYYDPREVGRKPPGGEPRVPKSSSYTEIVRRVNYLFEKAPFISLTLEIRIIARPKPEENTYRADYVKVKLIVMLDELRWFVREGYSRVGFEKYADKNGKNYWRITAWWDRTGGGYGEYLAPTAPSPGTALATFK